MGDTFKWLKGGLINSNYNIAIMSTFKLKSEKNKCLAQLQTLDGTHKMYENKFINQRDKLPNKRCQLLDAINKLDVLESKKSELYTTQDIQEKALLKSKITQLKSEIYDIENDLSEIEYYSKTNDVLMEYYALVERYDEDDVDDVANNTVGQQETVVVESKSDAIYDMSSLEQLNHIKNDKKRKRKQKRIPRSRKIDHNIKSNDDIMGYFGVDVKMEKYSEHELEVNRKNLFDNFLILVDSEYAIEIKKRNPVKLCQTCNKEKTLVQSEGFYVCLKCGEIEHVIIEMERTSAGDPMPEKSGYPYKRINHLNESLAIQKIKNIEMSYKYIIIIYRK